MSDYRIISKRTMLLWMILLLFIVLLFTPAIDNYTNTFLARMDDLAKSDPDKALDESLAILRLVFTLMALLFFCFGFYLVYYGRKSIHSKCFPPPHSRIIEGRRIISGHAVEGAGRLQVVVGYLLIAFALLILMIIWWMLARLPGL